VRIAAVVHQVDERRPAVGDVVRQPPEPAEGAIDELRPPFLVEQHDAESHPVEGGTQRRKVAGRGRKRTARVSVALRRASHKPIHQKRNRGDRHQRRERKPASEIWPVENPVEEHRDLRKLVPTVCTRKKIRQLWLSEIDAAVAASSDQADFAAFSAR
jgi:hypothetical protein